MAKYKTTKLPESTRKMFEKKIADQVESVESLTSSISYPVYRIKFKGVEPFAYIISEDPGKNTAKLIHYCETNEKGSQCSHLGAGCAIGYKLGLDVNKLSFGNNLAEIEAITASFPKESKHYSSMNSLFDLLEPVDEEEESTTSAPTTASPTTPKKPTPVPTKRNWKSGWNEIKDYLSGEGLSNRLIALIQNKRVAIHDTVSLRPMTVEPKKPSFPYSGEMLGRAIRHVLSGKDLILIGGKGTGKDTMIATLSWIFGLPMSIYVGNKDETKESLVGEPAFRNGESTFDPSEFAKTIEFGGIVNMAEVNMLVGDVTSILHSVADENRVLASPIGAIHRNEHSVIIGSMNVGEGYVGVKELNEAFKDRFAILRLPYTADFKKMLSSKTGLTDTYALEFLEKVKKAIEKLISEESQGMAANTLRGYIDAANYFNEYGVTFDTKVEVIEDYVVNKIEDLDEYMSARHMIRIEAWKDFPVSAEEEEYEKGEM